MLAGGSSSRSRFNDQATVGFASRMRLPAVLCLALRFVACGEREDAQPAPVPTPAKLNIHQTIPEPPSWSFPDVVESARVISPRNIEGRKFDRFGLAYSPTKLESLPVATMPPMELQKYADVVTYAYPDAVFRQAPDSCKDMPLEGMNETSVANLAYVSLHAIDPATRERAATCLKEVQGRWEKKERTK